MSSLPEVKFLISLKKPPQERSHEDLDNIYYFLRGMESLCSIREPALRSLCKSVRHEFHEANDVLYCRGEMASCWYILLNGSVFIDGSMFLPRSSFGKRTAGCIRRTNECLILEASEMIVVDYPDAQAMRPGVRTSEATLNLERLVRQEEFRAGRGRFHSEGGAESMPPELHSVHSLLQREEHQMVHIQHHQHHHHHQHSQQHSQQQQQLQQLQQAEVFGKRSSRASDTSSAYSGSDVMQSSLDDQDVDFAGLRESLVDSDEEEGYDDSPTVRSLIVRDTVRECLEKEPAQRTEDDIEVLLDFMQHFMAFANMTLATRRALCAVMVFAIVDKTETTVMNDGEELDSWSVILNGRVEVERPDGTIEHYHMGDSFGVNQNSLEKQYHKGVMRTKEDDCQFVCIAQEDYYKILHEGEENTQRVEEGGQVVLVTERRELDGGNRKGRIVIRGTPEKLCSHLVAEHSAVDPTYVEDFLLTYRTYLKSPLQITENLLSWFNDSSLRDKVTRVVLLWVNNHFNDFETQPAMSEFLEKFEQLLEREGMQGQLRLLNIACAAKARPRVVVLTRATRDEILHFHVLGGLERCCGIFITKVERGSKAGDVGLKRGDQILEVNNHSFERISHSRALEILRGATHLSITVKSNLLAFKEMLQTPDASPSKASTKKDKIAKLQADPKQRMSSPDINGGVTPIISAPSGKHHKHHKEDKKGSSLSSGHKTKIRKALMKFSLLPRNVASDPNLSNLDDSGSSYSRSRKGSSSSTGSSPLHTPGLSASNPDLSAMAQYDESKSDFPEHVLKVYRSDQTCKYFPVHRETSAREIVMLAFKEFGITEPSSKYSLCEVTVEKEGLIKQKRLPDQLTNLPDRLGLNGRYYLKNNESMEPLVPDDMAGDLLRECLTSFLALNSVEMGAQLTLRDFELFRNIEPTEFIDNLFDQPSKFGSPHLSEFAELLNKEMFWVVTEVCSESNLMKRVKIIKHFVKIACHCKDCKNFNSMFAIVSGLGHLSVSRLRATWERVPSKYTKLFQDLQDLMDPSRNMSKYRNLVNSEMVQPPLIPFYPVVNKDLTFIDLGNDSKVEGLVNFEKLRMIAKEVRHTCNMASVPYDMGSMTYSSSQGVFSAFAGTSSSAIATMRRKRRSTTLPNPKKMFEEAQMVRRVRLYLEHMRVIDDEPKLDEMSLQLEPAAAVNRKRDPSPGPANLGPKFGAESPEAVRKLMGLADKVRPHNPKQNPVPHQHLLAPPHSPTTTSRNRPVSPRHKRQPPPVAVNLSSESSSVVSLSGIANRKSTATSSSNESNSPTNSVGSSSQPAFESDSGLNSQASSSYDSHSASSVGSTTGSPPPAQKRTHSDSQTPHPAPSHPAHLHHAAPPSYHPPPPPPTTQRPPLPPYHVVMQNNPAYSQYVQQQYQLLKGGRRPPVPPDYHVATQMAQMTRRKVAPPTSGPEAVANHTGYFHGDADISEQLVEGVYERSLRRPGVQRTLSSGRTASSGPQQLDEEEEEGEDDEQVSAV